MGANEKECEGGIKGALLSLHDHSVFEGGEKKYGEWNHIVPERE